MNRALCPVRIVSRCIRRPFVAALVAAALICPTVANAVAVRDAAGRSVTVNDAGRIVAIGGAVTEILYALGLQDRTVAVDTTSLYPPNALKDKPNVGYMRALSAEGVLGLNPSVILAVEGAGPKETVAVLEAASIPYVRVPDHFTGDGILEKIRLVADATNAKTLGECLAKTVESDLEALANRRKNIQQPVKVLFVLSLLNGKPMVAGRNTAADGIIRLAGGVNAIDAYDGYKQISDEAVIAAAPDTVLVMQRPQDNLDAATVFAQAAFTMTPAAARKSFVAMDGLYLLGFGPRTASAARDLAAAVYPALGKSALPSETANAGCH